MSADWLIFRGTGEPHDGIARLPAPPPWREFAGGPAGEFDRVDESSHGQRRNALATTYQADPGTVELVNTALYLRRPLLVTGEPGVGKSTLAYAVAHELRLGAVLRWPITSRSTLRDGLYRYDAIGRIEDASSAAAIGADLGRYLRLGALGTALAPYRIPRVLLIDEIDKSDFDFPNDLLNIFEEGDYEIPELARIADTTPEVWLAPADLGPKVLVKGGHVACRAFPLVIMTSNQEREFPSAFLRRCVRLDLPSPDHARLGAIVRAHLGDAQANASEDLIATFLDRRKTGEMATDQLLNAVYLVSRAAGENRGARQHLADLILRQLNSSD
ncbi:ATPase AAA [Catellatospora sp. TT07R-123]|uniref:AAA family ATPase n=1 Tax=Catellatospora sp. TT07R-123 TaxID=2733863 RepID=UPI001B087DEB|nr:MoxR family ATPase [Catellatospora sp. TT07R-123]GHJ47589.1 ATPase AAA [Catellatospora sp. TT07R-123]